MGKSDDPRVQAQLDRLSSLSIQRDILGLDAVRELLSRLGDPHLRLPPLFHVAGTNGKGSTCAFLRSILEAEGYRVHTTTSPHLVRYNERFRIAGNLIEDSRLAELLEEVFDAAQGLGCSFFEITIAAAFTEFARTSADACVVEVGLGGRLDATNVLEAHVLAACGIATLGIDHERFLLAPEEGVPSVPMARIAFEKAGIAKSGVPLVALSSVPEANNELMASAMRAGAKLALAGEAWDFRDGPTLAYQDERGRLNLPAPSLPGAHQFANAALAVAMLRHQDRVSVGSDSMAEGMRLARWPARLQRLSDGPLTKGRETYLDGGHNPSAGLAIAGSLPERFHAIIGMLDNKNPQSLIAPLEGRIESLLVVPVPGHDAHPAGAFGQTAKTSSGLVEAMQALPDDGMPVLIAGSLYLAGEALKLNNEIPD